MKLLTMAMTACVLLMASFAACATPLTNAINKGELIQARALIERGADVNAKDEDGNSPLLCLLRQSVMAVAELNKNKGNVNWKYYGKVHDYISNTPDMVQLLVENGADVNAMDNSGVTPLFWAAGAGMIDTVKFLIEKGADVNARAEGGVTPLFVAAEEGMIETVKILIENGSNINVKADNGKTPLSVAVKSKHFDCAEIINNANNGIGLD